MTFEQTTSPPTVLVYKVGITSISIRLAGAYSPGPLHMRLNRARVSNRCA